MIFFIQEITFSPEKCISQFILIKINEKKVLKRNPLCLNIVTVLLQKTDIYILEI